MAEGKKRINSKQKGSEYELKIAKILSKYWGEEFHRTPMSGGLHWKSDNRVAGDIVTPPDSVFPFSIECKKRESWQYDQLLKGTGELEDYWKQCVRDAEGVELRPLLIFSKNFQPDYCMVRYKDFEDMVDFNNCFNYFKVHIEGADDIDRAIFKLDDFIAHVSKEQIIKFYHLEG